MKTFKKWHLKPIKDYGAIMSPEAVSFCRAFKNYIKREFPDCEVIGFKPNHYDTSGFIKKNGKCVYIYYALGRGEYCRADFDDSSILSGVLVRKAADENDYHGGQNHFTSIRDLRGAVSRLCLLQ